MRELLDEFLATSAKYASLKANPSAEHNIKDRDPHLSQDAVNFVKTVIFQGNQPS